LARFAIIGCAGYVAPRHLQAIRDTGNELVAACDVHDSVGVLDRFAPNCMYFREIERFDRHLYRLKREGKGIDWLSICTPNYLHDAHARLGLRLGADVICEKPLVLRPWNLDQLQEMEMETGGRVFTVMQLRYLETLRTIRERIIRGYHDVKLTYITPRGPWYRHAWKGRYDLSGGPIFNIGIHFLDVLTWIFGRPMRIKVNESTPLKSSGEIHLALARVEWFLSLDRNDLPEGCEFETYRSLAIDGEHVDLSDGFTDLHTRVYQETLSGSGVGIEEARPAIELAHAISISPVEAKQVQVSHATM
jgi:UDP-N-acetyl-2-amino-2-deoxyglucuronate dehydrogenase